MAIGNPSQIQKYKAQTGAPGPRQEIPSHRISRKGHKGEQERRNYQTWKAEATGEQAVQQAKEGQGQSV